MKYKVLITGKYNVLRDVFFTHMQENFECYSCSPRTEDILNHLKLFTPDVLVYGLNREPRESSSRLLACVDRLREAGVPVALVGDYEACSNFNITNPSVADLTVVRPFTASSLTEKLVSFLQRRQEELRLQEEQRRQEELRLQQEMEAAAARKRILVIDDDPLMLKLIKEHLHEEYEVGTALSGKIAMKFLEKRTVDLILLDFEMPEENGPMVLQKIHENEAIKDVPVLFLTGTAEKKKIREALAQKPQGYILKPIDKDKLMKVIKQYV